MAATQPERKFFPIPVGGTWKESVSPFLIGEKGGLTACNNITYRRYGTWGKRPGSDVAYLGGRSQSVSTPVSGTRWYRSQPSNLTQTVIVANNQVWTGNQPNGGDLTPAYALQSQDPHIPISFASAFDANNNAHGPLVDPSDILIMCGAQTLESFATGAVTIGGTIPQTGATQPSIQINFNNGGYVPATQPYLVLPTDNFASIGQNIVSAVQNMNANFPGAVGLATFTVNYNTNSQPISVTINLGARLSGAGGNSITYSTTSLNLGTLTVTPSSPTNMTGGGKAFSGPIKYDGGHFGGLSWMITNAFTGCVAWHDHIWYWGDEDNPNTLYASDINNPQGFSFMDQVGGYEIGTGDSDQAIQTCVPIGNYLYIFKRDSIYIVSGYNFQAGEYQFSIEPYLQGVGTPAPNCVAVLNNALVFWDGARFVRLSPGSQAPEHIGQPISTTAGQVAGGSPAHMRVVAGSFRMQVGFNGAYTSAPGPPGAAVFTNVALFACDVGNGVADTVLVYDDDATQFLGEYAWAPWTGWTVGGWIPFGTGLNSNDVVAIDNPILLFIDGDPDSRLTCFRAGSNPSNDNGAMIPWSAQSGWVTMGTPGLTHNLHRVFLHCEANAGMAMLQSVFAPLNTMQGLAPPPTPAGFQGNPQAANFPTSLGYGNQESFQVLIADIQPAMKNCYAFMFSLSNTSRVPFEINGLLADYIENPFTP